MDRAYAVLHVKSANLDTRTFTGIATTPQPDRAGDVLEPLGVTFRNPLPLLLHHDKTKPVGTVVFDAPTKDGITFTGTIPEIFEPGAVKDRVDEAWHSIKAGLLTGVSVGFRVLQNGFEKLKSGRLRLTKTEVCELSLVTIPANAEATILTVKALDAPFLAASGLTPSGVSELPVVAVRKDARAMNKQTITEQIATYEKTRKAKADARDELMQKSVEAGTTFDAEQTKEYEDLGKEIESIDAHLVRLHDYEKQLVAEATPVQTIVKTAAPVITVKPNVAPGTAFVRAACATLVCKGNFDAAANYAERWKDSTPEVALYLKAAVAAGNTTDATWAGPLVNLTIVQDFLALLRPATILGKIGGLRRVPFNCKVPSQTAGGSYGWVGEAKPKPVTKLDFSSQTLGIAKAAGIILLTEELVRLSNPAAEDLCRQDMVQGIARFLDQQFIDPAVAAVAGVHPASITNGAPTVAATTNPLADLLTLINNFVAHNVPLDGLTIIMSEANALALSFQTFAGGEPKFPGIGIGGGSFRGINFVTSQAANGWVIALQPSLILYADDGGVTIDASREASVQMDSAPDSPPVATTVLVSLWQQNLVGLRAERYINWLRANPFAVTYLTAANYPAPAGAAAQEVPTA